MVLNQDPDLPILKIRTLEQFFRDSLPLWVLTTAGRLFSTFGVVALILAVAGVYGMRAYVVSQRSREIAIRLALGAEPRTVRWMMVSEGFTVGGAGLVIGIAFAWALSRVLRGMLVGVSSTDPIVFASACATLALAVLAASYVPARRVTNMAPTDALRSE
jgi:ABC-type antimicrobial peptide transport system permease subunit